MALCNHPHPSGDHGTLGCQFGKQGDDDCSAGKPMKEASAFFSEADYACYQRGYAFTERNRQAGRNLFAILSRAHGLGEDEEQ